MKTKRILQVLPLIALPLLAGCVSDAASFQIDGKEHSLSLVREQKWLWEKKVELSLVVSRMPACQRRHHLKSASIATATAEVYSPDFSNFYLKQGTRIYAVETQTCEGFRELTEAPAGGMGQKVGVFKEIKEKFSFEEDPALAQVSGQK